MLGGVQSGDLLLGGHPQAVGVLDDLEHNGHGHYGVGGDGQHPQALHPQLAETAAVEQPAVGGQQAGEYRARQAAAAVDRHRAHRVVDVEPGVHHLHNEYHQDAGDQAHHGGAQGVQAGAARGDAHQPRQGGIQAHAHVRLAVFDPGEQHTGHRGRSGGNGGAAQDLGQLGGIRRRRAVEAIPAEPQDEGAHGGQGDVVAQDGPRPALPVILADAGPQQDGPDQPGDASHHVDDGGPGEVDEAHTCQPALGVPHPARLDGVDHGGDHGGVDAVAGKLGALRHGPGHDGGGGGAEHQLEKEVGPVKGVEVGEHLIFRPADESEEVIPAVHDAIAQSHEHHCADAEVHQVFHDDVPRVLGPGEASLHGGKPALHEEHQNSAHQIPY